MEIQRILIIIQRSNGDVFLSNPLKEELLKHYPNARIDYLVNADTLTIAKTLPHIHTLFTYHYSWKKEGRFKRLKHEWNLIRSIRNRYDLAINLTASDRSVVYAIAAAKISVSAIEAQKRKSWWKRLLLTHHFNVDPSRHILRHTMYPLTLLGHTVSHINVNAYYDPSALDELKNLPFDLQKPFFIFHPSAQYDYKIYPRPLRDSLLEKLSTLGIPIVVTGGNTLIDQRISSELPPLPHLINLIGQTSLQGYIALCDHVSAYIGMDTLNMHIAAALNKPIFAIFGPTLIQTWSPWSNALQQYATEPKPLQSYGNITLFQADMPCVPCGRAGCNDRHGKSDCLYTIDPNKIAKEIIDFAQ